MFFVLVVIARVFSLVVVRLLSLARLGGHLHLGPAGLSSRLPSATRHLVLTWLSPTSLFALVPVVLRRAPLSVPPSDRARAASLTLGFEVVNYMCDFNYEYSCFFYCCNLALLLLPLLLLLIRLDNRQAL